jgi:integrase
MTTTTPNVHARTGSAPKHERPLTTDADVGALPRPRKGRRDYHVKDTPALVVRVSSASVVFIVRKRGPRVDGKPGEIRKVVIGHFPAMNLEAAKEEAVRRVRLIDKGADPKLPDTAAQSLGEAWKWAKGNRTLKPSTLRDYEDRWKRHLSAHEDTPMRSITPEWIKARMDGARENAKKGDGVVDANRLRSLLGTIFTEWCERNPGAAHPVRAVRKAKKPDGTAPTPRTQKLTVDQARIYARALERYAAGEGRPGKYEDGPYQRAQRRSMADYLTLNLYVGLRKSNGIGLRWQWIDLDAATITVPASETKTKKKLVVNIPAPVLSMLKRRHADTERHPVFVFPGRRNSDKPMNSPNKAHEAILKLAGLPDGAVTIHDMRRTLGSAMIANGADVSEVREQLGHANIATTSIYLNLHGEDTVKKSLERAAAAFGAEDAA